MKKYKKRLVETLDDICCDICGESCKKKMMPDTVPPIINFEFATLNASWGYGSSKDGEVHFIEMCERCFDEVFAHIQHMRQTKKIKTS